MIFMGKNKDIRAEDYQDFATFELFSMINNSEYKDRLPKTLEHSLRCHEMKKATWY